MEIRTLGSADLPACADLAESRSWPREPPKWALLHDVGQVFGVDAPDGPGLAACAALVSFEAVASISMVLVASRFERRGLGRAITAQALAAAGDRVTWLHASTYGRPLYESMGFVPDGGCQGHVGTFIDDGGPGASPGSLCPTSTRWTGSLRAWTGARCSPSWGRRSWSTAASRSGWTSGT
ncbi:GNAT family N-acetyltransferase [Amycolatopsis sp. NBRC 101858]|uniref:GNAT family N-acetyltransferase n=1 Tax=Amycolatopsis sp. NBRC 101858 TaxID=3032200 RepID=UPI0025544321|nr:GNAT family N-acetyltransferase [Amycolatopsis sp. NBRC 101858]